MVRMIRPAALLGYAAANRVDIDIELDQRAGRLRVVVGDAEVVALSSKLWSALCGQQHGSDTPSIHPVPQQTDASAVEADVDSSPWSPTPLPVS